MTGSPVVRDDWVVVRPPDIEATTATPGTTETICVPRMVTIVEIRDNVCVCASQTSWAVFEVCPVNVVPGAAPPATTLTATVPKTVATVDTTAIVWVGASQTARPDVKLDCVVVATAPLIEATTDTPGTTDTICVPRMVTMVETRDSV